MNRRAAKREACFRVAMVAESALATGDLWMADHYPDEADQERVADAITELIQELHRRGWREP